MKRAHSKLGYKVFSPRSAGEYGHLEIEVKRYIVRDAAREWSAQPDDWHRERMERIRAAQDALSVADAAAFGTIYLDSNGNESLTFEWQDDSESRDESNGRERWYAIRATLRPVASLLKLLPRIARATESGEIHWNTSPSAILDALDSLGAIPVRHVDRVMDGNIHDREFDRAAALGARVEKLERV